MGSRAGMLVVVLAAALPAAGVPAAPDLSGGGALVAYTPSGYTPGAAWRRARAAGLRADAEDLARFGARAIVTERTTAALKPVCRFFKRHGFAIVIVGVADPTDAGELRAARALRRCADGYAVGNGGLAAGRYDRRALEAAVSGLRRATGRPVAVREEVASYRTARGLLGVGDWTFPLLTADLGRGAQDACGVTMAAYRELLERGPQDRPIALASTGVPTAQAAGANEHAQRAYFSCLSSRGIPFAYGEAYDQPWRGGAAAARGLFRADGTPKLLAWRQARPRLHIARTTPALAGRVDHATPARYHVLAYVRDARWTPRPPRPIARSGRWEMPETGGAPVVVLLAAPGFAPAAAVDRPPPVDGVRVFAAAETAAGP